MAHGLATRDDAPVRPGLLTSVAAMGAVAMVAAGCTDSRPPESQSSGASLTPVEPASPQPAPAAEPADPSTEAEPPGSQDEAPLRQDATDEADAPTRDDAPASPEADQARDEPPAEPTPAQRPRPRKRGPSREECERARIRSFTETVCDDQGNCFNPPLPPGCR